MRIVAAILFFSLAACSASHDSSGDGSSSAFTGGVSQESLQAFQNTVYAFGNAQGCVNCHGRQVNPQWMNADPATAYSFARSLLDPNNPLGSPFATYVANNHCNNPICANSSNIAGMQDALAQWAAVEFSQGGAPTASNGSTLANPPFVTATMSLPSNPPLITSGQVAVIRFNLSQLSPPVPALNGAILELSIQSYNNLNTTFKVFNPRLAGNNAAVKLSGLHIYLRTTGSSGLGSEDLNTGDLWAGVVANLPIKALPSPLPAGPMTSIAPLSSTTLAIDPLSASDQITIGFADIQ